MNNCIKNFDTIKTIMSPYVRCTMHDQQDYCSFRAAPLSVIAQLLKLKLIKPNDTQNASPTVKEFVKFVEKHPEITFHGYVIGPKRGDCRISIEGLEFITKTTISLELRLDFILFNRWADELECSTNNLHSWWD